MLSPLASTFNWLADHMIFVFGPVGLGLAWKMRGWIDEYLTGQKIAQEATHGFVLETKNLVEQLANNHLKHIELGITNMDREIGEQTKLLISVDKNIAVMTALSKRD